MAALLIFAVPSAELLAAPVFSRLVWGHSAKAISRDNNFGSSKTNSTEASEGSFPPYYFQYENFLPDAVAEEMYGQAHAGQTLSRTDNSVAWTANVQVASQNDGTSKGFIAHGGDAWANADVGFILAIDEDTYADITFQGLRTMPFMGMPIRIEAEAQFFLGDSAWNTIKHDVRNWNDTSSVSLYLKPGVYSVSTSLSAQAFSTMHLGGKYNADVGVQYSLVLRPVPEPGAGVLAGLGAGGLALLALQRRRSPSRGANRSDSNRSLPQAHDERSPPHPLGRSVARS